MDYKVTIEVDAEDIVNNLDAYKLTELTKSMAKTYFDLNDILEVARDSYTDMEILEELDEDDMIQFLKKKGYEIS